ncbi:helix-turn-helix domain-containing protein [Streptomyces purpurascens]|uniref:helix-turn-helix domain-containing protein n=1 Tax=Streptomyces purpurascens TaxID=1924 RepID=UPI003C2FB584
MPAAAGWRPDRNGERPLNEVTFLTVAEVASVMRVSKMTVYRLVHSGHLPAIRVGRSFRVPEQAVYEYLRASYTEVIESTDRP